MVFGKDFAKVPGSRINSVTAKRRSRKLESTELARPTLLADVMQGVSFPARSARTHYRHPLSTLTYVTIDTGNGGIIRNLNSDGVAVQAVARLRPHQRVRLRFELRFPRFRVETYGEVSWANDSGQCGIRFLDLPARNRREINEWIFSNLLDGFAPKAGHRSIFENLQSSHIHERLIAEESHGLILSARPRPPIRPEIADAKFDGGDYLPRNWREDDESVYEGGLQLNWLSRPLSGTVLAWLVDSLIVLAALLLFTVIFLAIAHELPVWPLTLAAATAAAVLVAGAYWTLFVAFGGASLGVRIAQSVASAEDDENIEEENRFR